MSSTPSISYLYTRYYSGNREMRISSTRENSVNHDVVSADTTALSKALDAIDDLDFDDTDTDNTKKIYNTIMSFVDTYNNTVDSAGDSSTSSVSSKASNMKKVLEKYEDELEDIGITIKGTGKISVDKSTLKTSTTTKVRKIFSSEDSDFSSDIRKVNKKLKRSVTREAVPQTKKKSTDSTSEAASAKSGLTDTGLIDTIFDSTTDNLSNLTESTFSAQA